MPEAIVQQETAMPIFIGYTRTYKYGQQSLLNRPVQIFSLLEYEQYFGGPASARLVVNLDGDNQLIGEVEVQQSNFVLYYTIKLFFANGGRACYVISAGRYAEPAKLAIEGLRQMTAALAAAELIDVITLLALPDATLLPANDYFSLLQKALIQCSTRNDRFAILDVMHSLQTPADYMGVVNMFRAGIGTNNLSFGAAYFPWLISEFMPFVDERTAEVLQLTGNNALPADLVLDTGSLKHKSNSLYHINPDLYLTILASVAKARIVLPPCGAVAGTIVKIDHEQGVWKAPVNSPLAKVRAPIVALDDIGSEALNVDMSEGKSINAIRSFPGRGTLIWGARTLAGNNNEWKYIPVRRLFITVEESIRKGIEWVSLESNDSNTWGKARTIIENYLSVLWRQGALQGSKTNEAFYVAVGLGQTMSELDISQGRMIIEIGMAIVRPAEFTNLRIELKMQTS